MSLWLIPFAGLLLLDMQNVFAHLRERLRPTRRPSSDFTIIVPLFGSPLYLRNRDWLARYKLQVIFAIGTDVAAMADLADELEQDGWRVHRVARATPTPPELTLRALYRVETTYVVRLDGDSWLADDVGCAVAAAARVRADLCSVKVLPSKRESIAERLQGVEYDCAMLNRRIRPWLTSGACMIARTDALRFLLYRHSRWFCGEDIETGVLAKRYRMNVHHIETEVFTEVPPSFRALWHQRALWWAGSFRQTWINFEHGLRTPLSLLYSAWLVWLMFVAKALTISAALKLLPPMIVLYTCILITANWSVKSRWMVLYPYYALVQSLLLPIAGIYSYVRLARHQRDLGRYRIGLRRSKTWLAR